MTTSSESDLDLDLENPPSLIDRISSFKAATAPCKDVSIVIDSDSECSDYENTSLREGILRKDRVCQEKVSNKRPSERKIDREDEKRKKEDNKIAKQLEKEAKKKEKEFEKLKMKTLREAQKQAKPGECMKFILVMIDPAVLKNSCGGALLEAINKTDMKYEIQNQVMENIITFWREVTKINETSDQKIETQTSEVIEDQILLWLPVDRFVELVENSQQSRKGIAPVNTVCLTEHVTQIRELLENRHVTLVVQGLEGYFKGQYNQKQRQFRENVTGQEGKGKNKANTSTRKISRYDVEEALVDLQLKTDCNIKFTERDEDTVKTILRYAKAVAEAPFKRERLKTGFSFHMETSGNVKLDKDGFGITKLWRQQLQQFHNLSAQTANAIIAEYATPLKLWQAYQQCASEEKAKLLLQDIVVRRGAGVMETTRRVGKELSRRIYEFMTKNSPDDIST